MTYPLLDGRMRAWKAPDQVSFCCVSKQFYCRDDHTHTHSQAHINSRIITWPHSLDWNARCSGQWSCRARSDPGTEPKWCEPRHASHPKRVQRERSGERLVPTLTSKRIQMKRLRESSSGSKANALCLCTNSSSSSSVKLCQRT